MFNQTDFRSKLVGTWQCMSYEQPSTSDPDDIFYPWGKDVTGFLMYSSDGYMSALVCKADLPKFVPDAFRGTSEQQQANGAGVSAYCGRVELGDKVGNEQVIYHHVDVSVPPNWIGGKQTRYCTMMENEGKLYIEMRPAQTMTDEKGVERSARLRFAKKPNVA